MALEFLLDADAIRLNLGTVNTAALKTDGLLTALGPDLVIKVVKPAVLDSSLRLGLNEDTVKL